MQSTFRNTAVFELGIKELEGIKDANGLFCAPNQAFASLIPSNSLIPNSNKKLLSEIHNRIKDFGIHKLFKHYRYDSKIQIPKSEIHNPKLQNSF
jgi:hypothetical protein